jgi:hypothetical protein
MGIISHENAIIDNELESNLTNTISCETDFKELFKEFIKNLLTGSWIDVNENDEIVKYIDHTPTKKIYDKVLCKMILFDSCTITITSDYSNSTNGRYFIINLDNLDYYVWFKTSQGENNEPVIDGMTGIKVSFDTDSSANIIASAISTALNANASFSSTSNTDNVTISNNTPTFGINIFTESFELLRGNVLYDGSKAILISENGIKYCMNLVPSGYISEVCTIYSIWYLRKQFKAYDGINGPPPTLFNKLKEEIFQKNNDDKGFRQNTMSNEYLMEIFNPDIYMGTSYFITHISNNNDLKLSLVGSLFKHIKYKNDYKKVDIDKRRYVFDNFNPRNLSKTEYDIAVSKEIIDIITRIKDIQRRFIYKYSNCIFKEIFYRSFIPNSNVMLATGDGSGTAGIFGEPDSGVFFFLYFLELENNNLKVMNKVSLDFEMGDIDFNTIIHLSIFGLDHGHNIHSVGLDILTKVEVIFGSGRIYLGASTLYPQWQILTPINSRQDFILKEPDSGHYVYEFKHHTTGKIIATYDIEFQDLIILESNKNEKFRIEMQSSLYQGDYDEQSLSINIVQSDKVEIKPINLQAFFKPDIFELSILEKLTKFPNENSIDIQNFNSICDTIVDRLIRYDSFFEVNMKAGFVGKIISPEVVSNDKSKIETDKYYNFPLNATSTTYTNENSDGTTVLPHYDSLKYSFGIITVSQSKIGIYIESYVDPIRSRLDDKFSNVDYRKGTSFQPSIEMLDSFTAPNIFTPLNGGTPIKSYNPLLSGLRCFGILEAITFGIYSSLMRNRTFSDAQKDIAKVKLKAMFNNHSLKIQIYGVTKKLSSYEYKKLKWYKYEKEADVPSGQFKHAKELYYGKDGASDPNYNDDFSKWLFS